MWTWVGGSKGNEPPAAKTKPSRKKQKKQKPGKRGQGRGNGRKRRGTTKARKKKKKGGCSNGVGVQGGGKNVRAEERGRMWEGGGQKRRGGRERGHRGGGALQSLVEIKTKKKKCKKKILSGRGTRHKPGRSEKPKSTQNKNHQKTITTRMVQRRLTVPVGANPTAVTKNGWGERLTRACRQQGPCALGGGKGKRVQRVPPKIQVAEREGQVGEVGPR